MKVYNRSFNFFATLPSMMTALLPKLICPICWPAYAGLLSTLGISLSDYTQYLTTSTIIFLTLSLWALGYRAQKRWGYRPLLLGAVASTIILLGKFHWDSNIALYVGVMILLIASIWNIWPLKKSEIPCNICKTIS